MIRSWRVEPDREALGPDGPIAVVSQDALHKAAYDLVVMIDRSGGHGSIVTRRTPTGNPNEAWTIDALVSYSSHTDAKPQAENTETATPLQAVPDPEPDTAGQPDEFLVTA